jgi:surface antigen
MVIFRIFSNLFGLVMRMGFNLLWLPVFLLTRNLFLTIMLVLGFMGYLYFTSDDVATRERKNANPATIVVDAKGNKVQVATPVRTVENGDSAFTNDLYAQMTEVERVQYSQHFFHAMNNVADGQNYAWAELDIGGSINPGNSFKNNSGEPCRMFSEALKVHAVQQNITGMACSNGNGTWCKLSTTATPACGLGRAPSFMDSISGSLGKLF